MADTTVTKVNGQHSPRGPEGEVYLASGKKLSMRLWQEEGPTEGSPRRRDYETVGYVVSGRAELVTEGQTVRLEPGDSWVVPEGAEHSYRILEAFTAVEATAPPAQAHGRDDAGGNTRSGNRRRSADCARPVRSPIWRAGRTGRTIRCRRFGLREAPRRAPTMKRQSPRGQASA